MGKLIDFFIIALWIVGVLAATAHGPLTTALAIIVTAWGVTANIKGAQ